MGYLLDWAKGACLCCSSVDAFFEALELSIRAHIDGNCRAN